MILENVKIACCVALSSVSCFAANWQNNGLGTVAVPQISTGTSQGDNDVATILGYYVGIKTNYDQTVKSNTVSYNCNSDGTITGPSAGVHFYHSNAAYYDFANLPQAKTPLVVNGQTINFGSSEAAFQSVKVSVFGSVNINTINTELSRRFSFEIGRMPNANVNFSMWDGSSTYVMAMCLYQKFKNNPSMLTALTNTRGLIVEHTKNDNRWGDGSVTPQLGSGENRLGCLLMALREFIAAQAAGSVPQNRLAELRNVFINNSSIDSQGMYHATIKADAVSTIKVDVEHRRNQGWIISPGQVGAGEKFFSLGRSANGQLVLATSGRAYLHHHRNGWE